MEKLSPSEIAARIAGIGAQISEKHGYTSRVYGHKYINLVKEIADGIVDAGFENSITLEVLDFLTEWNCHTEVQAARLVRYALFSWVS